MDHKPYTTDGQLFGLYERNGEPGVVDFFLDGRAVAAMEPGTDAPFIALVRPSSAGPTPGAVAVEVSATELRNLAATAKELVAAPGAGKALVFKGALVRYRGGDVAFDSVGSGEDLQVKYTSAAGQAVSPALDTTTDINFGATDDAAAWLPPVATVVVPVEDAPLILDQVGGGELASTDDDSDGDGTLLITVLYEVWDL